MARVTIGFGVAFIALGVGAYLVAAALAEEGQAASATALIPVGPGVLLALLGWLALQPSRRKLAMHIAVVLGLLAFLAGAPGFLGLLHLLSGGEVERPLAAVVQALMATLAAVFVGLCVKSFVEARQAAASQEQGTDA